MNSLKFEKVSVQQWEKDVYPMLPEFTNVCAYENIVLPKRQTSKSAGYDFYSPFSFTLMPGSVISFATGIKVSMPDNVVMTIVPRSSMGFKGIRLLNTVGVVDADYYNNEGNEGHCFIKIKNDGERPVEISIGDRIAQALFLNYLITEGDNFENGEVRSGGMGSTKQ